MLCLVFALKYGGCSHSVDIVLFSFGVLEAHSGAFSRMRIVHRGCSGFPEHYTLMWTKQPHQGHPQRGMSIPSCRSLSNYLHLGTIVTYKQFST